MATANVTPNANGPAKKHVTMTVFDLQAFDDVKLYKDVELPARPTSIEQALELLGNDKEALLSVIYDGLIERTVEQSKSDPASFFVEDEDAETPTLYTGTPIDEKKGKQINLMVLNLAKAMGYEKSLPLEKRKSIKAQAFDIVKSNPAMLAALQGAQ